MKLQDDDTLVETCVSTSVRFRWDYTRPSSAATGLFAQAKESTWNPDSAVDWTTNVDFGSPISGVFGRQLEASRTLLDVGEDRKAELGWHIQAWTLSQFLHGEQGGLLAAARLVEAAPDVQWKLCAAGQVMDEAKHVDVFSRYLDEKLGLTYPVNTELQTLLTDIVSDGRWDMVYLGMQVLVEGVAIGSFKLAQRVLFEPLARQIVGLVLRDEARHVAMGVLALGEIYPELTASERAERLEFVRTALSLLNARFRLDDVRTRLGLEAHGGRDAFLESFRRAAMSRVNPLLRRLSLWDESIASLVHVR